MTHEEVELRKMKPSELIGYHNVLVMNKRMLQVTDDPGRNQRHLDIVNRILGVKPEDADKRLTAV